MIRAHLRRQGVETQIVRCSASVGDAGQAIGAYAAESRTDLVVAGAYGHPSVMGMVFGGTTRSLLANSPAPVFLALRPISPGCAVFSQHGNSGF
ncbi:universal stress protein [Lysobacter antibioticus]|uniref:universal stress protein n=1 Tax=Lysobacter TaxID=68 RepID=UPI0009A1BCC4